MSILGLTIDYGPFGFLDHYDPNHICNASGKKNIIYKPPKLVTLKKPSVKSPLQIKHSKKGKFTSSNKASLINFERQISLCG